MMECCNHLKSIQHWRSWIGLAGIHSTESPRVQQAGNTFEWFMLIILIWLPFQWYFRSHNSVNFQTAILDNWVIWFAFVTETAVLSIMVRNKIRYLADNWLNLIIIFLGFPMLWTYIPSIAHIQIFFLLVMIAILVPWLATARRFLTRNHLGTTLIVFTTVTFLAGLLMSIAETESIHTPQEGIWWAFQTVTTIGYGDVVPTTLLGRIIAVIVMLLGIGLFSLLTANFSAFFLEKDEKKQYRELEEIRQILERLEKKIDTSKELSNSDY